MSQRGPVKRVALVLVGTGAVALVCFSVFFQSWTARGPSMWPGLFETRFVTMRAPFAAPRRGDVVVFRLPLDEVTVIKRVVGMPGDTIEIRDGRVLVGGEALGRDGDSECPPGPEWLGPDLLCWLESAGEHRWIAAREAEGGLSPRDASPVVVPAGEYYLIGDMRTQSNDSRNPGIGTVPLAHIEGRVVWGETPAP